MNALVPMKSLQETCLQYEDVPGVWRNPTDKSMLHELLKSAPDMEFLTDIYEFASKGFRKADFTSWHGKRIIDEKGSCNGIFVESHHGKDWTDSVFSPIAGFLTRQDRDNMLELYLEFEKRFWREEIYLRYREISYVGLVW